MRWVLFLFLTLFHSGAFGFNVNRLNGGINIVYIDFSVPGTFAPLELARSYNSITATSEYSGWSGVFGWGWNSQLETTLTTTPERAVLLRDGATGNTVVFRPKNEDESTSRLYFEELKAAYFARKWNKDPTPAELKKVRLPENFLRQLKSNLAFRISIAEKYGLKTTIPQGDILVSSEYGYQTLQFKDNQWVREKEGTTQFFNSAGHLVRHQDKNGFYFDYVYSKGPKPQLNEISDRERSVKLKFFWRQDKIIEVVDHRNKKSRYSYDNTGNLVSVTDSNGQTYLYKYENKRFPHLITQIEYPNETVGGVKVFREVRYDDSGLITYHRDKDKTETNYTYGKSSTDPENNFWTRSTKINGTITETRYDEFFIKVRPDGSKYLHKQDTKEGTATSTTVFTACCGKPLQSIKNGEITNYKYFENGLLKEKIGPNETLELEYDLVWKKVTRVKQNGMVSFYQYDSRGNLSKAQNSRNESVALRYDESGRIAEMVNEKSRKIVFRYNRSGKPTLITEKGIGSIAIDYDEEGKIIKTGTIAEKNSKGRVPSQVNSQEIIKRVMQSFQNLLEIIRPAGVTI